VNEQHQDKLLLDVNEVARLTGLSRSHIYTYLLRGDLRSLKVGRRRKIAPEAVREFIENLQVEDRD
jgi:excisionase family DNA binding protein